MTAIEIASEPRLDADHPANGVPIPRLSTQKHETGDRIHSELDDRGPITEQSHACSLAH